MRAPRSANVILSRLAELSALRGSGTSAGDASGVDLAPASPRRSETVPIAPSRVKKGLILLPVMAACRSHGGGSWLMAEPAIGGRCRPFSFDTGEGCSALRQPR